jgi:hypothetical protein
MASQARLDLLHNPMAAVEPFDTSQHPAHTFEEPNSLTVDDWIFLRRMRETFPGHFAMTFIGFALGKRPSTPCPPGSAHDSEVTLRARS